MEPEDSRNPIVTIVIPCFNASRFLADALESVQNQVFNDFECIVIDDASTDGSKAFVKSVAAADSRFKLIELRAGRGVSAARNEGIKAARGRWLAMLDADDLFVSDRLQRLVDIAEKTRAEIAFDDLVVTEYPASNSNRRAFGLKREQFTLTQDDFFVGSRFFRTSLPMGYMKPLISRDFLKRAGAAYDPSVPSGEDFLFYAQLFAAGALCVGTSFAGYVYRRRRGSLSRSEEHLHQHAQLGERVLREFGAGLSETSRNALAGRGRDFARVAEAMPAMSALRRREWRLLASLLVRRPTIVATGLSLLKTRAARSWSAARRTP